MTPRLFECNYAQHEDEFLALMTLAHSLKGLSQSKA